MNESTLGFIHFIYQADFIARSILVVMLVASVLTWVIIVDRFVDHCLLTHQSEIKSTNLEPSGIVRTPTDHEERWPYA